MEHYFLNFPVLNYEGYVSTNILARPYIRQVFKDNYELFYQYKVPQGHRPDKVAYDLYGKSEYLWVIYLFNDIIDPFYDWVLSEDDFNEMIKEKYGTIENSQRFIMHYRNNWYTDDSKLDSSGYNALPKDLKVYWRPRIVGTNIVEYERKPLDKIKNTNQILTMNVSFSNASVTFTTGEYANQGTNGSQVAFSNSSTLVLKHIVGSFSNTSSIVGATSNATVTVTSSIVTQNVISTEETSYFSPVYAYDFEQENNENRSRINLVKPEYVPYIEEKLADALR